LCAVEARAADAVPTNASPATAASAPKTCAGAWDFIDTNCQLTWYGITVYGTIGAGVGWQSHGAPFDPRSAVSASYLIQKQNRSAMWGAAPNALSQSIIGIKGTEPIGGNTSLVFALDAGFDPSRSPRPYLSTRTGTEFQSRTALRAVARGDKPADLPVQQPTSPLQS